MLLVTTYFLFSGKSGTPSNLSAMFLVTFVGFSLLVLVVRAIYRLTLHPLARFPGPKRAAVSSLYGALWDIPFRTSFVKDFTQWHEIYNSDIVRIGPNQLHIRDFNSYNEIFRVGSRFGRDPAFYEFAFTEGSFWANTNIKEGLAHRALYHQYFSRAAVQKLEPTIQSQLSLLLKGIDHMRKEGIPADLTLAFRCFAADTLGSYMFDQPFGFLETPNFQCTTVLELEELVDMIPVSWYGGKPFVQLIKVLKKLPRSWIGQNGMSATFKIDDMCAARLLQLSKQTTVTGAPNIFQTALNPDAEKGQPEVEFKCLVSDAAVLFTAGSETTSNMLSYCIYHLHRQPAYLRALRAELKTMIPSSDITSDQLNFSASWTILEKLPLLRAAIKETLRIAYGVPGKLPRVVPDGGASLAGQRIPGGTVVTSCSYIYYNDPKLYPDPLEFRPERWTVDENADGTDRFKNNGGVDPEKYFTSFSRGSRNCLGINLAYAELFLVVAYLLRTYEMELFEMKPEDMEWHDCFVAVPFGHLKVKIVGLVG